MDYSIVFVCLMGMGIVFFGLICLILLTTILGRVFGGGRQVQPAAAPVPAPATAPAPARQAMAAAVGAANAEEVGTDITGIRILSMKKL